MPHVSQPSRPIIWHVSYASLSAALLAWLDQILCELLPSSLVEAVTQTVLLSFFSL